MRSVFFSHPVNGTRARAAVVTPAHQSPLCVSLSLPRRLAHGEAKIDLAIIDDKDQPRVWFAIDAKTEDGWHPLTSLDVTGI